MQPSLPMPAPELIPNPTVDTTSKRPAPWLDYDLSDREGEEWRDVTNYDGLYQVSNHGRVKSLARLNRRGQRVRERIRKQAVTSPGAVVELHQDHISEKFSVMRLVAEEFLPAKAIGLTWIHANKKPLDNRVSNILSGTPSESRRRMFDLELVNTSGFGQNMTRQKLKYDQELGVFDDGVMVAQVCRICKEKLALRWFGYSSVKGKKYLFRACSRCRHKGSSANTISTALVAVQNPI